jgi:hypothetical protein
MNLYDVTRKTECSFIALFDAANSPEPYVACHYGR